MLVFKSARDERDYFSQPAACNTIANARLKALIALIETFTHVTGCGEIVITSYYRPEDTSSYHSILQAADIRSKDKPEKWKRGLSHLSQVLASIDPHLQIYMHPELHGTANEHVHIAIRDGAMQAPRSPMA